MISFSFFIKECKEFLLLIWYTSPFVGMDGNDAIDKIEGVNEK